MIASLNRFFDAGSPIGIESRKEQRRLNLGAGDRNRVVNRLQSSSCQTQRRPAALGFNSRPHHFERLNDARHRTTRKRRISLELTSEFLPGKNPAQHANGRTRISAIEASRRGLQLCTAAVYYH